MRRLKKFSKSKYLSIQMMITLNFVVLIFFIILLMSFITYAVSSKVVKNTSSGYVEQLVNQVNRNIDYYIQDVEVIARHISNNNAVQNYLKYPDNTKINDIQHYLNNFVTAKSDIVNIMLLMDDQHFIINDSKANLNTFVDYKTSDWYVKALEKDGLYVSTSRVENLIEGRYNWVISCSSPLKDMATGKNVGMLLINLNYNRIKDMCSDIDLGNNGYVFILNQQGDLIYHPKQQLIYSSLYSEPMGELMEMTDNEAVTKAFNHEKRQYVMSYIDKVDWRVIGAVDMNKLLAYKSIIQEYAIVSGLCALVVAIFLAIMISRQILHPLKDLAKGISELHRGDFRVQVPVNSNNEVSQLCHSFNDMARRIDRLIQQINEEEKQKRKNELKALQAQINPHFLYNTLDAIIWMAELKDYKRVTEMTSALAKLFRISISKGHQFITIGKEIEHVNYYLKIQKMRYGEKLQYDFDVPPHLKEYVTLKLLLQPIVENAIYHGIKYKDNKGHIHIALKEQGEELCFMIEDDGVGMTEDELMNLKQGFKESGVGMHNVDERVSLYFGGKYGVTIDSSPNKGTKVCITVPKMKLEEGQDEVKAI